MNKVVAENYTIWKAIPPQISSSKYININCLGSKSKLINLSSLISGALIGAVSINLILAIVLGLSL